MNIEDMRNGILAVGRKGFIGSRLIGVMLTMRCESNVRIFNAGVKKNTTGTRLAALDSL